MPPKRAASTSAKNGDVNSSEQFTRSVREKLSSYTRTGQACDRCKIRKIRCDALQEGCSPCKSTGTECRTTDRISRRAVPRGYVENLEAKCSSLEAKVRQLEAFFGQISASKQGVQPGSLGGLYGNSVVDDSSNFAGDWNHALKPLESVNGSGQMGDGTNGGRDDSETRQLHCIRPAAFKAGNSSNLYLGLSAGNAHLNNMRETALSVLGFVIDLTDLDPSEPDPDYADPHFGPTSGISYEAYMRSIFGQNRHQGPPPSLPDRAEMAKVADWYWKYSYPYLPLLHRPTFVKELERCYSDQGHVPSAAQTVMSHMMVAIMHYQVALRSRMNDTTKKGEEASKQGIARSHLHYHYSLSFMQQLLTNRRLEDLQAIAMILQHIRGFPKPGASWLLAKLSISMAVEQGLHRSQKEWLTPDSMANPIEVEMRKRVFWCILCMEAGLAAKLGRPLALRVNDFDAEMPLCIPDECITREGILPRQPGEEGSGCGFDVAVEMFKYTVCHIEIVSTLYTVNRPSTEEYERVVVRMEKKLRDWQETIPSWLSIDSPYPETKAQAAHLALFYHECCILLRHPSLGFSASAEFQNENLRKSVESSREILRVTDQLRTSQHDLDTTWYATTVQFLATLTILYSLWIPDKDVEEHEIAEVRKDMELCMSIMADVGRILGSSSRLKEIVATLTERTITATYARRQQREVAKQRASSGSAPSMTASQAQLQYESMQQTYPNNSQGTMAQSMPYTTSESPSHAQALHAPQFNPQMPQSAPAYPTHAASPQPQAYYANEWLNYGRAIAYYPTQVELNPQTIGIGQALLDMGSTGPSHQHPQAISLPSSVHSPQQAIVSPMAPQQQSMPQQQQHHVPSVIATASYPPQPNPRNVGDPQGQGHSSWPMGVPVNAFGYPETNPRPNGA
ncbi:hypothetical protein BJ508DRAFT_60417 [Ascobolus immersus RN42]|uniref:Zn(2)-C6 fungal-type domain-containing protein n=1 Tax=Ascobolus immersus RN42 TaxID=1160509 RepID=A0A3N4IMW5_ASCIM|nr:hypothetical protein BJ508DRAFT_60417 [Ascobolus immersus RN42]